MESPLQTIERLQQQVRDLESQLAAVQQGVQPFGYVNTHTGQFFKDVEPCRQNNEGHWRTVYTHPTTQRLDAQDAKRYRHLRDEKNIITEDDACVTDSMFVMYFGEDLDKEVDRLIARNAAADNALAAQAKQAEALQASRNGGCGCCSNACTDRADGCRFVHENPSAADMDAAQGKQGGV